MRPAPARVILSRKGFDSAAGGMPSPILPDGRLVSLPIPGDGPQRYDQLQAGPWNLAALLADLAPGGDHPTWAHADPDLVAETRPRAPGWRPNLGQAGAAQSHLLDQGVGPGDLFLFFGWFRQTEAHAGRLRWVPQALDLHVIFGFLYISERLDLGRQSVAPAWAADHPHAQPLHRDLAHNALWIGQDEASAGHLRLRADRVLTAPGQPRSRWRLPDCVRGAAISYHQPTSWKADHFQSAARGQEFVILATPAIQAWADNIIQS